MNIVTRSLFYYMGFVVFWGTGTTPHGTRHHSNNRPMIDVLFDDDGHGGTLALTGVSGGQAGAGGKSTGISQHKWHKRTIFWYMDYNESTMSTVASAAAAAAAATITTPPPYGTRHKNHTAISRCARAAFYVWQKYIPVRFVETLVSVYADIRISFRKLDHGDGRPFDGPGGTLAHAFFPSAANTLRGQIHLDSDENWQYLHEPRAIRENQSYNRFSLYDILIHEIGHSLGLGHNANENSVMYPYYTKRNAWYHNNLPTIDILNIQRLYGGPYVKVVGVKRTKKPIERPETTSTLPPQSPPIPPPLPPLPPPTPPSPPPPPPSSPPPPPPTVVWVK